MFHLLVPLDSGVSLSPPVLTLHVLLDLQVADAIQFLLQLLFGLIRRKYTYGDRIDRILLIKPISLLYVNDTKKNEYLFRIPEHLQLLLCQGVFFQITRCFFWTTYLGSYLLCFRDVVDPLLLGRLHGLGLRLVLGLALLLLFEEVRDAHVHDALLLVLKLLVV